MRLGASTPGLRLMTKHVRVFFAALFAATLSPLAAFGDAAPQPPAPPATARPNVVLLLVDDAALMDFGAYGGEARTPNIDALAARGALFTNYHTSPLCSPSRAMILTGVDNHRTGVATIEEVLPPEQHNKPGYSLHLEPGVVTIAARLKQAGYRTYMTGKRHLGHGAGDLPDGHGFDRSFALDASGADNWEQKPYMPYYQYAPWFEDGKPADLPKDFYSSQFIVDRSGRLWVREAHWQDAIGAGSLTDLPAVPSAWSVFDVRGRWLGDVRMPANFQAFEIGDDYVAGKARTNGVNQVVIYSLGVRGR